MQRYSERQSAAETVILCEAYERHTHIEDATERAQAILGIHGRLSRLSGMTVVDAVVLERVGPVTVDLSGVPQRASGSFYARITLKGTT